PRAPAGGRSRHVSADPVHGGRPRLDVGWTPTTSIPERADQLRLDRRARDSGWSARRVGGPDASREPAVHCGWRPLRRRPLGPPWPLEARALPLPHRPPSVDADGDPLLRRIQLRALGGEARRYGTR